MPSTRTAPKPQALNHEDFCLPPAARQPHVEGLETEPRVEVYDAPGTDRHGRPVVYQVTRCQDCGVQKIRPKED